MPPKSSKGGNSILLNPGDPVEHKILSTHVWEQTLETLTPNLRNEPGGEKILKTMEELRRRAPLLAGDLYKFFNEPLPVPRTDTPIGSALNKLMQAGRFTDIRRRTVGDHGASLIVTMNTIMLIAREFASQAVSKAMQAGQKKGQKQEGQESRQFQEALKSLVKNLTEPGRAQNRSGDAGGEKEKGQEREVGRRVQAGEEKGSQGTQEQDGTHGASGREHERSEEKDSIGEGQGQDKGRQREEGQEKARSGPTRQPPSSSDAGKSGKEGGRREKKEPQGLGEHGQDQGGQSGAEKTQEGQGGGQTRETREKGYDQARARSQALANRIAMGLSKNLDKLRENVDKFKEFRSQVTWGIGPGGLDRRELDEKLVQFYTRLLEKGGQLLNVLRNIAVLGRSFERGRALSRVRIAPSKRGEHFLGYRVTRKPWEATPRQFADTELFEAKALSGGLVAPLRGEAREGPLVLLVDKSGSTNQFVAGTEASVIDWEKALAIALARRALSKNQPVLISFFDHGLQRPVYAMVPGRDRRVIQGRLEGLEDILGVIGQGGTDIPLALVKLLTTIDEVVKRPPRRGRPGTLQDPAVLPIIKKSMGRGLPDVVVLTDGFTSDHMYPELIYHLYTLQKERGEVPRINLVMIWGGEDTVTWLEPIIRAIQDMPREQLSRLALEGDTSILQKLALRRMTRDTIGLIRLAALAHLTGGAIILGKPDPETGGTTLDQIRNPPQQPPRLPPPPKWVTKRMRMMTVSKGVNRRAGEATPA